ncbi:MAG: ABC transporter permease [Acidimicrobiales bacterium]
MSQPSSLPGPQLEVGSPEGGEAHRGGSPLRLILSTFVENHLAVLGVVLVVLLVLFCFVGPLIYHTDQVHVNLLKENLPPGSGHPLGTDEDGYNQLGRLMVGGQTSIEVGLAAAALATLFGVLWGSVAGYFGGWVDSVMMRVVDSLLAIPSLFLLLVLATIFTPDTGILIFVVAVVAWLVPSRLVRGESLTLRTREYVQAVRVMGGRGPRIIRRHLIPNTIGTIAVAATFQVADAILLIAALSFLGLGPQPPAANWGEMLSSGVNFSYDGYWWLIYPPGIAIVLTVVAFNFIGDALRDSLEVRLRQR